MRTSPAAKALGCVAGVLLFTRLPSLYGNLREKLVEHIDKANSSIDLVVYDIGSDDIADALIAARRRSVRVRVIVDNVHSNQPSKQEQALEDEGVSIKRVMGVSREQLHEKFILFDGSVACTPSYNRSAKSLKGDAATESFSNDTALISKLKGQFDSVWQNAETPDSQ